MPTSHMSIIFRFAQLGVKLIPIVASLWRIPPIEGITQRIRSRFHPSLQSPWHSVLKRLAPPGLRKPLKPFLIRLSHTTMLHTHHGAATAAFPSRAQREHKSTLQLHTPLGNA